MSIKFNDNSRVRAQKLADERSGPYNSTAEALASININERAIGLTVIINQGGELTEYWFKGGIADGNLQLKNTGGDGGGSGGGLFEYITPDSEGNLNL